MVAVRETAARAALALGLVIVLSGAGACGSTLSPNDIKLQFSLSDASQLQPVSVAGGREMVTVTGGINVPGNCAGHGLFSVSDKTIDATVESLPLTGAGPCTGSTAANTYTLTLTNVPAGQWLVRVHHKQSGAEATLEAANIAVVVRH
jgi:hypothetical protein